MSAVCLQSQSCAPVGVSSTSDYKIADELNWYSLLSRLRVEWKNFWHWVHKLIKLEAEGQSETSKENDSRSQTNSDCTFLKLRILSSYKCIVKIRTKQATRQDKECLLNYKFLLR